MVDKLLEEAIETVESINDDIHENSYTDNEVESDLTILLEEGYPILTLNFAGNAGFIIFFYDHYQLWCSEDDERDYINEDEEEYEPLKPYIQRKLKKLLTTLNQIKL